MWSEARRARACSMRTLASSSRKLVFPASANALCSCRREVASRRATPSRWRSPAYSLVISASASRKSCARRSAVPSRIVTPRNGGLCRSCQTRTGLKSPADHARARFAATPPRAAAAALPSPPPPQQGSLPPLAWAAIVGGAVLAVVVVALLASQLAVLSDSREHIRAQDAKITALFEAGRPALREARREARPLLRDARSLVRVARTVLRSLGG